MDGAEQSEEKKRRAEWKRRGLLLNDDTAVDAMDPQEGMPRLNCKRNKDGILEGDIASREQMRQLEQYVFQVLGRMVDDIASGKVEPNPYTRGTSHDACRYCPYGAVCHQNSVEGRRNYQAMEQGDFWDRVEKEVEKNG